MGSLQEPVRDGSPQGRCAMLEHVLDDPNAPLVACDVEKVVEQLLHATIVFAEPVVLDETLAQGTAAFCVGRSDPLPLQCLVHRAAEARPNARICPICAKHLAPHGKRLGREKRLA